LALNIVSSLVKGLIPLWALSKIPAKCILPDFLKS
jgi:hypothetical protein